MASDILPNVITYALKMFRDNLSSSRLLCGKLWMEVEVLVSVFVWSKLRAEPIHDLT